MTTEQRQDARFFYVHRLMTERQVADALGLPVETIEQFIGAEPDGTVDEGERARRAKRSKANPTPERSTSDVFEAIR